MNAFLLYILQSALCLSLFYGLYALLLRRETFFRFNRSMLLAIMVLSMTIPVIRVPVAEPVLHTIQKFQDSKIPKFQDSKIPKFQDSKIPKFHDSKIQLFHDSTIESFQESSIPENFESRNFEIIELIPLAYLAGLLVSLFIALVSFISVARVIATARPAMYRQQRILVSPLKINSFNFAGWIVLSEMDYERFAAEIVIHENIHRSRGHFWDLCIVNFIAVIHWFNPLVGFLRREMKALHEYEADRCTLSQGIDVTRYKLLLIEKAAGASRYSVASGFAQSKTKKRINMMNKQNPNPWARWKALLFIPLAALLMQAFARPETNRELEQISNLKGTEILQENTGWNKEKFLEELRKCLPAGASHELSYEETRKLAFEYTYPTPSNGMRIGCIFMMNRHGDMAINHSAISMEGLSSLFKDKYLNDDDDGGKILKSTLLEISVNAPSDALQQMLNIIGEAYLAKRNEKAQKHYQTAYASLNEAQKAEIDQLVPMLIDYRTTEAIRYFDKDKNRFSSKSFNAPVVSKNQLGFSKIPTEEEWEKAAEMIDREILYNGKATKLKDVFDLLRKDTNSNVNLSIQYTINNYTGELDNSTSITASAIEPKDPAYFYVIDGKWVYSLNMGIRLVKSINTYPPAEAVKKYGSKAKNGAISITCTDPVVVEYGTRKK